MDLTCPMCHEPVRTYERNGVHVDQCNRGGYEPRKEQSFLRERFG